nr:unnamed protein product [Chocolate lily virus A]
GFGLESGSVVGVVSPSVAGSVTKRPHTTFVNPGIRNFLKDKTKENAPILWEKCVPIFPRITDIPAVSEIVLPWKSCSRGLEYCASTSNSLATWKPGGNSNSSARFKLPERFRVDAVTRRPEQLLDDGYTTDGDAAAQGDEDRQGKITVAAFAEQTLPGTDTLETHFAGTIGTVPISFSSTARDGDVLATVSLFDGIKFLKIPTPAMQMVMNNPSCRPILRATLRMETTKMHSAPVVLVWDSSDRFTPERARNIGRSLNMASTVVNLHDNRGGSYLEIATVGHTGIIPVLSGNADHVGSFYVVALGHSIPGVPSLVGSLEISLRVGTVGFSTTPPSRSLPVDDIAHHFTLGNSIHIPELKTNSFLGMIQLDSKVVSGDAYAIDYIPGGGYPDATGKQCYFSPQSSIMNFWNLWRGAVEFEIAISSCLVIGGSATLFALPHGAPLLFYEYSYLHRFKHVELSLSGSHRTTFRVDQSSWLLYSSVMGDDNFKGLDESSNSLRLLLVVTQPPFSAEGFTNVPVKVIIRSIGHYNLELCERASYGNQASCHFSPTFNRAKITSDIWQERAQASCPSNMDDFARLVVFKPKSAETGKGFLITIPASLGFSRSVFGKQADKINSATELKEGNFYVEVRNPYRKLVLGWSYYRCAMEFMIVPTFAEGQGEMITACLLQSPLEDYSFGVVPNESGAPRSLAGPVTYTADGRNLVQSLMVPRPPFFKRGLIRKDQFARYLDTCGILAITVPAASTCTLLEVYVRPLGAISVAGEALPPIGIENGKKLFRAPVFKCGNAITGEFNMGVSTTSATSSKIQAQGGGCTSGNLTAFEIPSGSIPEEAYVNIFFGDFLFMRLSHDARVAFLFPHEPVEIEQCASFMDRYTHFKNEYLSLVKNPTPVKPSVDRTIAERELLMIINNENMGDDESDILCLQCLQPFFHFGSLSFHNKRCKGSSKWVFDHKQPRAYLSYADIYDIEVGDSEVFKKGVHDSLVIDEGVAYLMDTPRTRRMNYAEWKYKERRRRRNSRRGNWYGTQLQREFYDY